MDIIELLSGHSIVGITLNTEKMSDFEIPYYIQDYEEKYRVPVDAPLYSGVSKIGRAILDLKESQVEIQEKKETVIAKGGY